VHLRSRGTLRQSAGILLLAGLLLFPGIVPASAAGVPGGTLVAYYFTGEGCSHCARVNPVLLGEWLARYPELVVVEYEVRGHLENAAVMAAMDQRYGIGLGVPVLFFGPNASYIGDTTILTRAPELLNRTPGEGEATLGPLSALDPGALPGYPRIWHGERVLVREGREGPGPDGAALRGLLSGGHPDLLLGRSNYTSLDPVTITLGQERIPFEHALRADGWLFAWNGELANLTPTLPATPGPTPTPGACPPPAELTAGTIIALAAVNAVNPCALAVLVVILLAIITRNPGRRGTVLLAGLAFSLSVFVFYLAYGILLVSLFSAVREAASLQPLLTRGLGLVSVGIGLLHIREYLSPGKGTVGTGIPAGWKPRLGEALNRITSPLGAFAVGALVTLFLLPCNIGPYIIGCGVLAVYGPLVAIPYLLLYNLVFILPMLAITAVVYLGVARIGDVKGWREENIGRFHLASGLVILAFGILLLFGLI
jgi:hypothetical protein